MTGRHSDGRTFLRLSARTWFWIGVLTIEFVVFAILGWLLA